MDVDTVEVGHLEAHLREGHMECLLEEIAVLRLVADDDEQGLGARDGRPAGL